MKIIRAAFTLFTSAIAVLAIAGSMPALAESSKLKMVNLSADLSDYDVFKSAVEDQLRAVGYTNSTSLDGTLPEVYGGPNLACDGSKCLLSYLKGGIWHTDIWEGGAFDSIRFFSNQGGYFPKYSLGSLRHGMQISCPAPWVCLDTYEKNPGVWVTALWSGENE